MHSLVSHPAHKYRGIVLYSTAVFLISANQALGKFMVEKTNSFVVMQIRMAITGCICICTLWNTENFVWGPPESRKLVLIRGILGFVGLCCTYYALHWLSLPDKAALAQLVPVATMVSSYLILNEKVERRHVLAAIVALVGAILIARPPILIGQIEEQHRVKAVIASLIFIAVTVAGILILRKLRTVNSAVPVASMALVSLVCSSIILFISANVSYPQNSISWILLFTTGVLGFAIQYLESSALRFAPASSLVNLRYAQLIWATLWEFILWHDLPDTYTIVGSALVAGATYASNMHGSDE